MERLTLERFVTNISIKSYHMIALYGQMLVQRFKNLLNPITCDSFNGSYVGTEKNFYTHKGYLTINHLSTNQEKKEKSQSKLSYHTVTSCVNVHNGIDEFFLNEETIETEIDNQRAWLRRDGALIREEKRTNGCGCIVKNADVQLKVGNKLVKTVYNNYLFKGLFGGYWFAATKRTLVFDPCEKD